MSRAELDRLEREVEQARGRVSADLARLRSPGGFAEIKDKITSEVTQAKDRAIEKSKNAAREQAHTVLSEIKARVAANPVAALTVGAGLAWHFSRKPPITSLL